MATLRALFRWALRVFGAFMLAGAVGAHRDAVDPLPLDGMLTFMAIGAVLFVFSFHPGLRAGPRWRTGRAAPGADAHGGGAHAAALRDPLAARAETTIEMHPAPFDVLLHYRDGHADLTERRVSIHKIIGHEEVDGSVEVQKITGWCHLRRAERTFVLPRIVELADAETGEVVDPKSYLLAKVGRSPHR